MVGRIQDSYENPWGFAGSAQPRLRRNLWEFPPLECLLYIRLSKHRKSFSLLYSTLLTHSHATDISATQSAHNILVILLNKMYFAVFSVPSQLKVWNIWVDCSFTWTCVGWIVGSIVNNFNNVICSGNWNVTYMTVCNIRAQGYCLPLGIPSLQSKCSCWSLMRWNL